MNEVEMILMSAEARMKRRYHIEQSVRIKAAKVKKRNHPKRHSENKERSDRDRKAASKAAHIRREMKIARTKYLSAARAFWRGESDIHP